MSFALLILLTAVYFLRPNEWVHGLVGVPLFQIVVIPCIALSLDSWSRHLTSQSLRHYPISASVVGLFVVAALSSFYHGSGIDFVSGFGKSIIYYFLVVGIVHTRPRLSLFLQSLGLILFLTSLLLVLNYHGALVLSGPSTFSATGTTRLEALGANFDPNDTAALIVLGILISLHYTSTARPALLRPAWLALAAVDIYALQLTDSRGGFLALIVGVSLYTWIRWGKKGLLWGSLLLPVVIAKIATDRMATIGSSFDADTGQARIQFWTEGLLLLKHNPLLGVGPDNAVVYIGKALHNTFLQAFAELGFVGGVLFLGAFGYAFVSLHRIKACALTEGQLTPHAVTAFALLGSLLAAYGVAILSLNHLYPSHTYMVLAFATITARLQGRENRVPISRLFFCFAALGVAFVVLSHVTARFLVRW